MAVNSSSCTAFPPNDRWGNHAAQRDRRSSDKQSRHGPELSGQWELSQPSHAGSVEASLHRQEAGARLRASLSNRIVTDEYLEDEIGECEVLSLPGFKVPPVRSVHLVLLGDSTLDNGRYLNLANGELSVKKQLAKKCAEFGWQMTVLAQDGSLLEDVRMRQLPLIPDQATHLVLSASGNDLLSLLNQMVVANFTLSSVYASIVDGLKEVAKRYENLLQSLNALGCHLACCTVYRPNFNHFLFKSLAVFSLGLHNSRLKLLARDIDCSVIDLANMIDGSDDFANALELSTRGGAKVAENVAAFVKDHSIMAMRKYRDVTQTVNPNDDAFAPMEDAWGSNMRCCATRASQAKVYANSEVFQTLEMPDLALAGGPLGQPLDFSNAQQRWRET